jgi:hypothetical protein
VHRNFVNAVEALATSPSTAATARRSPGWQPPVASASGGDIRDLMVESVERRYGLVDRLPVAIGWLSDGLALYR